MLNHKQTQLNTLQITLPHASHQHNPKLPTNPFEDILNHTTNTNHTPDFNLTLPLLDDLSYIHLDPKSPTFSDIFTTMSQIKSPQSKIQYNDKFFINARKKPIELNQQLIKTIKISQSFKQTQGDDKFLQKMQKCAKEMNAENLQITKNNQKQSIISVINTNNKKNKQQLKNSKKPQMGYKLTNPFNLSTSKINKLTNQTCTKSNITLLKSQKMNNFVSTQSNPEEQGKITNPIAISYPKSPKIYKFSENNSNTPLGTTKIDSKNRVQQGSEKQLQCQISYKMVVPRRQLKAQMEQIYNGKFKLRKSSKN